MILSQNEVEAQVDKLQKIIEESDEYNLNSAFVTFHDRHDAVIVLKVFASDGNEEIVAELAPDTDDVIWNDLRPSSSPLEARFWWMQRRGNGPGISPGCCFWPQSSSSSCPWWAKGRFNSFWMPGGG